MPDQRPVHQVFGMQDRQTRYIFKGRGGHVIIIAYPYRIGIGVVGMQHGIFVGAISLVGYPNARYGLQKYFLQEPVDMFDCRREPGLEKREGMRRVVKSYY